MMNAKELLVAEAAKWIGTKEQGNNGGSIVEMFQKAVDGKAEHESWCMAFVQYCVKQVDSTLPFRSKLFPSEHCLTVWARTDPALRREHPEHGFIVIWQHGHTPNGHTGIVSGIVDAEHMETIEGNTSDSQAVERNGDGVYRKARHIHPTGEMHIVGYLDPFPES